MMEIINSLVKNCIFACMNNTMLLCIILKTEKLEDTLKRINRF